MSLRSATWSGCSGRWRGETSLFDILGAPLGAAIIGQILTTFAVADSLMSAAVTYTLSRRGLARWRRDLWVAVVLIWVALVLPLLELSLSSPPSSVTILGAAVYDPLTKLAVGVWLLGIALLLGIEYKVLTLDLIAFNKKRILDSLAASGMKSFVHFEPKKWSVPEIDKVLGSEGSNPVYPMVIVADESTRPWRILQSFAVLGLAAGDEKVGAIYFTFTRPPDHVYGQLRRRLAELSAIYPRKQGSPPDPGIDARLVIIDCFKESKPVVARPGCPVVKADPTNAHHVNQQYEVALAKLVAAGCTKVRVVYDALSDFLTLTDLQLATQYLRHNMVWEEMHHVESLYLLRSGTLNDETLQYFRWFANGELRLEGSGKAGGGPHIEAVLRGPFDEPRRFELSYSYDRVPQSKPV